jgi:GntR family transcriptional repressor for pyruvate dehydrogenase complex
MLEPIKTEKLYNIIMRRIFDLIKEQKLEPGDRLPSERELAVALSVSRASVRQAIAALSAKGVVKMRQGDGTYVSSVNGDKHTLELFGQFLVGSQIDPFEILEVRIMVECESARLCALRADEAHLKFLKNLLKQSSIGKEGVPPRSTLNVEIHTAIAKGAQNKALLRIMNVVWEIMENNMWPLLKRETSNHVELHEKHHREIIAAICDHDADRAYKTMYNHLNSIKEDMDSVINKSANLDDDRFVNEMMSG